MDHLDFSLPQFERLLEQTSKMVLTQYSRMNEAKAYHYHLVSEVESWFDEPLPKEGTDPNLLLQKVQEHILNTATGNLGPHMYAYVVCGGNQMALLAENLATTINQNQTKWHLAPALNEVEKRVIKWTSQLMHFPEESGGVMVSGGSAANLTGLTVGRNILFQHLDIRKKGMNALPKLRVYASTEVHGCIDKSLELLGIGSDNLIKIPTDQNLQIQVEALESTIQEDIKKGYQPFCIIGNAGTVNTGAIDPLDKLADIAVKYQLWYHVDGAYGALAGMLPSLEDQYKGMERADSLALDFHKWLYVHFEAGCTLVRSWSKLKDSYYKKATYLDTTLADDGARFEFNDHHFQLSRNAKAFKVWMTIKAYGMDRLKRMIQKDIDLTIFLSQKLRDNNNFRVVTDSPLAICCFQFVGDIQSDEDISKFNQTLVPALEKDGRVFIMGTWVHQKYVLRACLINHRKTQESCLYLLQVIEEVALAQIKKSHR